MKITLESTTKVVTLNGVPARLWEGHTVAGIPVHAYITRIAADAGADQTEFERELEDCVPPTPDVAALPARLLL